MRIGATCFAVASLAAVQRDVAALHLEPPEQNRGVRVALDVGEGVVLAVDRNPLTGADPVVIHTRKPKRLGHRAFEGDRPVGQAAVEEHRGSHECDAGNAETNDQTQTR